jgi:hypothetical protein
MILLCFHGPSVFEPRSDCKSGVVAMCIGNEDCSPVAIQWDQLLEQPEDFEDNHDNDNYSDYVEDVSAHAGLISEWGVR